MKRLATASALLVATALVTPAFAQMSFTPDGALRRHRQTNDSTGTLHLNVPCSLWVKDFGTFQGRGCDVGRIRNSPTSVFRVGDAWLKVVRNPNDKTEAMMYHRDGDGEWVRLGVAIAQGNCWTGSRVRFCAQ